MGYRKQAGGGRRDLAETPIVHALRAVGAQVWFIGGGHGNPDLLVRYKGVLYAPEVKTGKGKETKKQGEFPIWRTVDDALMAIGVLRPHTYESVLLRLHR